MDLSGILMNSLWGGLFGAGIAILFTAPREYLVATFFCGLVGRLVRDILTGLNLGQNLSIVIAAAVVVLVAVAIIRSHKVSPVVMICGVLPLGAATAMFNMVLGLMKLPKVSGNELRAASIEYTSNLATVFVTSLSIALGMGIGMAIVRLFRRKESVEV